MAKAKDRSGPRLRKSEDSAPENRRIETEKKSPLGKAGKSLRSSGIFKPLRPAGSLLTRVLSRLIPRYFVNSWREVRQVTWPTRVETWRLTLAVFIFATIFGAMVAAVDKGLDEIFKKLILK